jgi:hypothetical protein
MMTPLRWVWAVLVAMLVWPSTTSASRVTDIVDGFPRTSDEKIDFAMTVGHAFEMKTGTIRREFRCLAHDTIPGGGAELCPGGSRIIETDALAVERISHRLNVDMLLGFWRIAQLQLRIPVVVFDQTRLEFADGVDPQNSTVDPYNQASLFTVTNGGPVRLGLSDPVLSVRVAPFSLVRDDTRPSWTIDASLAFPASLFGIDVRQAGNTEVTHGLWRLDLGTGLSARPVPWVEPWFHVGASLRFADGSSRFEDLGQTQTLVTPGHVFNAQVGADFIPWEDRAGERAFIVELGASLRFQLEGRDYTDLFEALSSSPCDPRDPEVLCDRTTYTRGVVDSATGHRLKTDGITDVEQFAAIGGWIGLRIQVHRHLAIGATLRVGWEAPHFLTFADAGRDLDGDEIVEESNAAGLNEFNPVYNAHYDALGVRFRTAGATTLGLETSITAKF